MSTPSMERRVSRKASGSSAAASASAASASSSGHLAAPVDLTLSSSSSDVEVLSPPPKRTGSKPASTPIAFATPQASDKPLHPFFSMGKKPPPTPAAASAAPPPTPLQDERKESCSSPLAASSSTPPAGATVITLDSPSSSPAPGSTSPVIPVRCELDTLYASRPTGEFFMTKREVKKLHVEKRSKQFEAQIEAEAQERKRVLESFKESGKTIHPFLQPKASLTVTKNSGAAATPSRSATMCREASSLAAVHFSAEQPAFPPRDSAAHVDTGSLSRSVDLEWSAAWQRARMHLISEAEVRAQSAPLPISAPRWSPLRADELATLAQPSSAAAASAAYPAVPASLPLWARPPSASVTPVDYLTAPAFRSSDVTNYLAQPRAVAFLKDLVDKLAAAGATQPDLPVWTLEQVQKLARRLLIRRVHCFRAMQRDEQHAAAIRKQREADAAAADSSMGDSTPSAPNSSSSSSLSRSERAAQRGHKAEAESVLAHGDEQIAHTFQPRPDSLWSEQYRAFKSDEMFGGNTRQRAQVRDWLQSWSARQKSEQQSSTAADSSAAAASAAAPGSGSKRKRNKFVYYSDDEDFEDASDLYNPRSAPTPPPVHSLAPVELPTTMLLVGPPCGKTSLVYACCHENDTGIIEIGSNARRAQRDVLAKCEEATQSHRLALVSVTSGAAAAAVAAPPKMIAFPASPVRIKAAASKKGASSSKTAKEVTPKKIAKPAFNFFDSAANKKAAAAAAAAAAANAASSSVGDGKSRKRTKRRADDDDDSDDDDFSLEPVAPAARKSAVSASSTPFAAAASTSAAAPAAKTASKKSLFLAKTQSRTTAIKGFAEELPDSSDDSEHEGKKSGSASKKRKKDASSAPAVTPVSAASFFGNPDAFASAKKPRVSASSSGPFASSSSSSAAPPASGAVVDPLAPISSVSSQTALLFEEIDVVFPQLDRKFLPAVRTLVSNAKRPIILTATSLTQEMEEALALGNASTGLAQIEVVHFTAPRVLELLPYVYLIAAVEIGFHTADTIARMPTLGEIEQLLRFHHCDVRKTLLAMQISLTSTPLTRMLGSDNLLQAAANPAAAATAVKRVAAQLRLYSSERTSQQDLILAATGLLARKEELLALFDSHVFDTAVRALSAPPSTKGANKTVTALRSESATTAEWLSQCEALFASQCQGMQLLHLNYLQAMIHALSMTSPGADSISIINAPNTSWLDVLPVRLAVLPLTAEETLPIESVQLTPELLAVVPELPAELAEAVAQAKLALTAAEGGAFVPPAESAPVTEAPILPPMETASAVLAPLEPLPEAPIDMDMATASTSAAAPDTAAGSSADDDDDDEAEVGVRRSTGASKKKHIVIDEEEADADEAAEADASSEEEVEDLALLSAQDAAHKQLAAAEAAAHKHMQRALKQLRDQQRCSLRQELLIAEDKRRDAQRFSNRQRQARTPNRMLQRSLALLHDMADLAEHVSAVDVCTQPASQSVCDVSMHRRTNMRSHSRYHPAVHASMRSSSRDFIPLYLERVVPSSHWVSLEQQWMDEVEEESERGDRDRSEEAKQKQMGIGLGALLAPGAEKKSRSTDVFEDVAQPELDVGLDMASTIEVQAACTLRSNARRMQQHTPSAADTAQLSRVTTASLPSAPFYPSLSELLAASGVTLAPMLVDESGAIDLTGSPAPEDASAAQPLFLPSNDVPPVPRAPFALLAFRPPATHSLPFRTEMSTVATRIWEELQGQSYPFLSTAFLCDVFPYMRSLVCSALDSSHGATAVAADAELAQSLQRDGGRASRRHTRSTRSEPALSRRWQQVASCFYKAAAVDTVKTLQTCPWRHVYNRPLQLHSVWHAHAPAAPTATPAAAPTSASTTAAPEALPVTAQPLAV